MPSPAISDVHVDEVLTNFSLAHMQGDQEFVATKVFPVVPVQKQSDKYARFTKGDFNRDAMKKRAPGTESSGGGWNIDTSQTYYADVYAHHKDIDAQTRANADSWANLDKATSEWLARIALIRQEKDFVSTFMAGGVWTSDWDGTASSGSVTSTVVLQWNDPASTPIENVRDLKRAVQLESLVRPNIGCMGRKVFDKLLDHPDIMDRLKYGQTAGGPAMANREKLAALFELDAIYVMDAVENIAEEGQTASMSYIGGNDFLLAYRPPTLSTMSMMSGATFVWNGYAPGWAGGQGVSVIPMRHLKSDRYEIELAFDQKLICADAGGFIDGVVAD